MDSLETARLLLRPLTHADTAFIIELLNEPSFIQNIGQRNVHTDEEARTYITNAALNSYAKNGFGLAAVMLKETNEIIGMCGLIRREALDDVDLGYAFLPRFWGKGYAVESAEAWLKFGWEVIGLTRIVAIVDPANEPSVRVLEKLGFVFEKIVRLSADDIELKLFAASRLIAHQSGSDIA